MSCANVLFEDTRGTHVWAVSFDVYVSVNSEAIAVEMPKLLSAKRYKSVVRGRSFLSPGN